VTTHKTSWREKKLHAMQGLCWAKKRIPFNGSEALYLTQNGGKFENNNLALSCRQKWQKIRRFLIALTGQRDYPYTLGSLPFSKRRVLSYCSIQSP